MKTALITTTINIPEVLELYYACDSEVRFFVAIDNKTPKAAIEFCELIDDCEVVTDAGHAALSELIGFDTIARRNFATLAALKWGAEIIVTVDDDNLPMNRRYFDDFEGAFSSFNGISVNNPSGWFDVGKLLVPPAPHRGFPYQHADATWYATPAVGKKVGVAAGVCLGDPDISAITRIANAPIAYQASELLRDGIIVEPGTWTVFNSQNTAFRRELAPCFLMVREFQRYDDIFASLVAQRVMRELDMVVRFGPPFVWQQRNSHNLLADLAAEHYGMEHILEFVKHLGETAPSGSVADMVRGIYLKWSPFVVGVNETSQAWCDACEKAMA